MAYQYIKNDQPVRVRKYRWLPLALLAIGLFMVGNAIFPLVYYQLIVSPKFALKPGENYVFAHEDTGQSVDLGNNLELTDYTKLSNWISGINQAGVTSETTTYRLSVPKLGIQSANVVVGGDDLKMSLIQYPGTSLPGKPGNPVIFGHSTLPQFSKTGDYKSIFTHMPTNLQVGDDLWAEVDGVTYKYIVERMIEMGPNDLSILAQRYDDSYITLVTCVPPGTYLKRLVVRARITKAD